MELNYMKRNSATVFSDLSNIIHLQNSQNYIPIYKRFFDLNTTNYNSIELNHKYHIDGITEKKTENIYTCNISGESIDCFFKFSPLIEPLKYMIGKFAETDEFIVNLPKLEDTVDTSNNNIQSSDKIVLDTNNIPYIDGFFSFLSSKISEKEPTFLNGIKYYGSYLGIKQNYKLNVFDDIDYLLESAYFKDNINKLYVIDENTYGDLTLFHSRNNLKKIKIHDDENTDKPCDINLDIEELDIITNYTIENSTNDTIIENSTESICDTEKLNEVYKNDSKNTSSSSCSSRTSNTNDDDDEDEDEDEDDDEDEDEDEDSDEDEESVVVNLNSYPVQAICIEKCDNTLDNYMMTNDIETSEWKSILLQVIMTLITYQKCFLFTHNDLHTNNIMYINTKKEYIYYCFNNTYYKVPTFGKIYKIIDFGRSIYTFKGKLICSNSFASHGDAVSQYNVEPYLNSKKARLEPNNSFDLCRLGCSLFDFFIEDYRDIKNVDNEDFDDITKLINDWCIDDNGKNILYKSNGTERYPDFKLYKMIARTVHKHTPEKQLERDIFDIFKVTKKQINKKAQSNIFNIDKLKVEY
jgi:hypothetical protein